MSAAGVAEYGVAAALLVALVSVCRIFMQYLTKKDERDEKMAQHRHDEHQLMMDKTTKALDANTKKLGEISAHLKDCADTNRQTVDYLRETRRTH